MLSFHIAIKEYKFEITKSYRQRQFQKMITVRKAFILGICAGGDVWPFLFVLNLLLFYVRVDGM